MTLDFTTRDLKVAIFGAGKMGIHHIKAIQCQNNASLVAIADPALDSDELKRMVHGEVAFFDDSAKALAQTTPNVVHITTPPHTHAQLAQMALENGAHVYVEKPIALKLEDAQSMMQTAEEKGLQICPGHQLLFEYPSTTTRRLLPIIGEIVHIESYFSFRPVRRNVDPIDQLLDILPHPAYLLTHFLRSSHPECRPKIQSVHADPNGEFRALLTCSNATGSLVVSLQARPVESYLRITGTNGSIHADFVLGSVRFLPGPGASAPAVILNPFKLAGQTITGTVGGLFRRLFTDQGSYPGLHHLIASFYHRIQSDQPSPLPPESIYDTVALIEIANDKLHQAHALREQAAEAAYRSASERLPVRTLASNARSETVLVTGGTGFLGRPLVKELVTTRHAVRCLVRRMPSFADRVPGVSYALGDLGQPLDQVLFEGATTIVHCAAETAGNRKDHERNSVAATRHLLDSARQHGITRFIHISSVAVLTAAFKDEELHETSPVDFNNLARGPYVWGKAESERLLANSGAKIIRLAPLVDLSAFQAPGRLGREVGQRFVAVGNRQDRIGLCEVQIAAQVIRYYVESFPEAPRILNLVQPDAPTRGELVKRLLTVRPDLRSSWLPMPVVKALSPVLIALQKVLLPSRPPLDVYSAFASQRYDTSRAAAVIAKSTAA